jgi:O-antigen/teichoic acid export membrane protein
MIAIPLSAALGIVVTRLVIEQYGTASYAQYALLVAIGNLLPFADLGIAASIVNASASARDPRRDELLRLTLVSAMRVLSCSAAVVVSLAVLFGVTGSWNAILGEGLTPGSGPMAATLCLIVIGVTLLVSLGERLLAGLGKYYIYVVISALQTPIVLITLFVSLKLGLDVGGYVAVIAYSATFVISVVALFLANRYVRPTLSKAFRLALHLRTVRGARFLDTAWPMLVQMVALPIAMQTDRIVLSHVSSLDDLAEYSLAAQMFTPLVGVVATAGMALWPVFARARAQGVTSEVSPTRMSLLFGVVAGGFVLAVSLAAGVLSELASGGTITLAAGLLLAFSALVILQAVKYPLGMYMTDARGLRYQAYMIVLMLPVNLGLSIALAKAIGPAGPVLGSAVGVGIFQVLANWIYVRRALRSSSNGNRR